MGVTTNPSSLTLSVETRSVVAANGFVVVVVGGWIQGDFDEPLFFASRVCYSTWLTPKDNSHHDAHGLVG